MRRTEFVILALLLGCNTAPNKSEQPVVVEKEDPIKIKLEYCQDTIGWLLNTAADYLKEDRTGSDCYSRFASLWNEYCMLEEKYKENRRLNLLDPGLNKCIEDSFVHFTGVHEQYGEGIEQSALSGRELHEALSDILEETEPVKMAVWDLFERK